MASSRAALLGDEGTESTLLSPHILVVGRVKRGSILATSVLLEVALLHTNAVIAGERVIL